MARPDKMVGVILAAGRGTRIYPFSENLPKPILPVGNRPLIEYQLLMMRSWGITEVLIVIGHFGFAIVDALGHGERYGVTIRYVEQSATLGMAHALGKLEPYIDSPVVLFLGDIYFVLDDMEAVLTEVTSGAANAALISKLEPDPAMIRRNFAIFSDESGRVSQVIEKPRHVRSNVKGCGLYVFDQHIFDAIRRTPRTAMRDEYEITDSIQILVSDGYKVVHRPIVQMDMNLTVPQDLLSLNLMELRQRKVDMIIGQGVKLAPGTQIENSVIGDRVEILHPIRITNSLIFPGVRVDYQRDINTAILYGDQVIFGSRKDEVCQESPVAL